MIEISIKEDFSSTPGGRFIKEGSFSGEQFREELLLPQYERAEKNNENLRINFDGCFGFATSFLEEAFGGLVRIHHKRDVFSRLVIVSNDDETIPILINKYITSAEKRL